MMTTQTETRTKSPTHSVYFLKPKEDSDQPVWIKVGVAWEHGDKDGLNLSLNNLGQEVVLTLRKNKSKAK